MENQKFPRISWSWFNAELPIYATGLIAAFVICVLTAVTIWTTFIDGIPGGDVGYTLKNFVEVIRYPLTLEATKNTILLSVGTVAISVFFALPAAWLLHRTDIPLKNFFLTLMFLHILLPAFIKVMGWIMLISPNIGVFNQFLRLIIPVESGPLNPYNILFMAILQGLTLMPALFFMLAGAFAAIDPSYEESSEVCGASLFQYFRRIDLPLVMPALVAGSLYIFMTAISMFEIAALLGESQQIYVFSTLIYSIIQGAEHELPNYGVAGVYGVMMIVPMLLALQYYQKMIKVSHRYATVTGKGYRPKITSLGNWKWIAVGFIGAYFLIDLVFPFLAVLWTSFLSFIQLPSLEVLGKMNLDGYISAIRLLLNGGVLTNTLQLIFISGVLSLLISLSLSWIVLRTKFPGRFILDSISMLPHAIPSISFAFSMLIVSLLLVKILPGLHGSIIAIAIADAMRRVPFSTRTISSSLIQIHPELEEAVQISGGSRVTAMRKIIVPLIAPALFYSFVLAVLHAYREVTIALFLQGPKSKVMSTAIWQLWATNDTGTAAALAVIMVVVMGIIVTILLRTFPELFGQRITRVRRTTDAKSN